MRTLAGILAILWVVWTVDVRGADKVDFEKDVAPILESTCVSCHGAKKGKGKLRIHTKEDAFKGGKEGAAIVAGKPDESLLISRIMLPADDEDVMPPEDEGTLTKEQKDILRAWIEQGAIWPDGKTVGKVVVKKKKVEPTIDPIDPAVLANLSKSGVLALRVAQNVNWIMASYRSLGDKANDDAIAGVAGIAQLSELNLAGTAVTDAGLAHVAGLTNLTRLHLERTKITDAGLVHVKGMKRLYYLNLYGTGVTDAGLEHLRGLTALKRLYLWQTKVTPAGVDALKKAIPGIYVNTGIDTAPAKKAEPKKAQPKKVQPKKVQQAEPKKTQPKKLQKAEPKKTQPKKLQKAALLIAAGSDGWLFSAASAVQGDGWVQPKFDAAKWAKGKAPLGYGEAVIAQKKGTTLELKGQDLLFRREFTVGEGALESAKAVRLRIASDNSAIVWINGQEVDRDTANHEATYWNRDVAVPAKVLVKGRNVIAVKVNNSRGSSDAVLDVELGGALSVEKKF